MERCTKCGLGSNYPKSNIQEDGECEYCKNFKRKELAGEAKLIDRIGNQEKIGVTVSGGKDSIYTWYWLVKKFGAEHVVALNHNKVKAVDDIAIENIQRARKILKSEVIIVNDFDFYPRFLKNLKAYIDTPNPAILRAVLCSGCRYGISKCLFKEAKKYGIHTVINASSYMESVPFKSYMMKQYGEGNETKGLLAGLCENEEYLTENNLKVIIRDHFNRHRDTLHNKENEFNIDYIDFFDYLENDALKIKEIVKSEVNWTCPEDTDWHFDCIVEQFKQFFYLLDYGYSELDFNYSQMVRYGIMSKEESIKLLEEKSRGILASYPRLIKKLIDFGFDEETVNKFKNNFCERAKRRI